VNLRNNITGNINMSTVSNINNIIANTGINPINNSINYQQVKENFTISSPIIFSKTNNNNPINANINLVKNANMNTIITPNLNNNNINVNPNLVNISNMNSINDMNNNMNGINKMNTNLNSNINSSNMNVNINSSNMNSIINSTNLNPNLNANINNNMNTNINNSNLSLNSNINNSNISPNINNSNLIINPNLNNTNLNSNINPNLNINKNSNMNNTNMNNYLLVQNVASECSQCSHEVISKEEKDKIKQEKSDKMEVEESGETPLTQNSPNVKKNEINYSQTKIEEIKANLTNNNNNALYTSPIIKKTLISVHLSPTKKEDNFDNKSAILSNTYIQQRSFTLQNDSKGKNIAEISTNIKNRIETTTTTTTIKSYKNSINNASIFSGKLIDVLNKEKSNSVSGDVKNEKKRGKRWRMQLT
jgi:hypothetical protein